MRVIKLAINRVSSQGSRYIDGKPGFIMDALLIEEGRHVLHRHRG